MSFLMTPVSYGEVLDKITILEIKSEQIHDQKKLKNVQNELSKLRHIWDSSVTDDPKIQQLKQSLKSINQELWNIEDNIRIKESHSEFDDEFIQIARSVYVQNDQRAEVKKQVNQLLGSDLIEEKSYEDYSSKT